MSNLLKKNLESEVTTYGYPEIGNGNAFRNSAAAPRDDAPAEGPEPGVEETFRKRLLELERRAQEIEKEAYGKGFAQGEKDGFEYGQKAAHVVKSQLERIAASMNALPGRICRDYRSWLISTSSRIAKCIVKRELRISPEIVGQIAKSLLDEAEEHSTLAIYFNPQDLEFMDKRAGLDLGSSGKRFIVKPDPNLDRGDCRAESSIQLLDGSIETQFENLEDYLLGPTPSGEARDGQDAEMGSGAEVEQEQGNNGLDSSLDLTSPKLADDAPLEKRKSRLRSRGKKPPPKEMENPDGRNE